MLVWDGRTVHREENRAASPHEMVFMVLVHPDEAEVRKVIGETYHCHDLVVEDCLRTGSRPKIDQYDNHVFFPFYFLKDDWELVEISIVMGENFIITVLSEPLPFLDEVESEFLKTPEKMSNPGRILYEYLDLCVHHYLDTVDSIEEQVDAMENQVYDNPSISIAPDIFALKRKLHHVRRVFSGERSVIESLMHASFPYTTESDHVYLMDLFDHVNRIVDAVDGFRDSLSGLLDLQMALKSDRMNAIMKTLTIVSTLFMPLSLIVGWYGMNVKVPEYSWRYGYPFVWFLTVSSTVGFLIYFKKRRWF